MKFDDNISVMNKNNVLYHDNNGLQQIKHSLSDEQGLEVVAGQFEAMFLQMVLRQMRSSSDVLADEDNPFSSKQQSVYRDFYDGQLAIEMAKQQQTGIKEMLMKQLNPNQGFNDVQNSAALTHQALEKQDTPKPVNNEAANQLAMRTCTAFQQSLQSYKEQ
ncbi:flagellar protein [Photobacterium sp. GB-27]|uniref:rod-binding protein n=1 Tax=Photobacterium sp. GB-27 TaxID=2022109 RepID=UPI000D153B12|nr:rod-binding protein [Photobacterium sp. GB-27]PSV38249.1 flagellar protein [Photobacterium sp. GB-27]